MNPQPEDTILTQTLFFFLFSQRLCYCDGNYLGMARSVHPHFAKSRDSCHKTWQSLSVAKTCCCNSSQEEFLLAQMWLLLLYLNKIHHVTTTMFHGGIMGTRKKKKEKRKKEVQLWDADIEVLVRHFSSTICWRFYSRQTPFVSNHSDSVESVCFSSVHQM